MKDAKDQDSHEASRDPFNPEELQRILFEEAADGLFIADPQGRVMAVNRRGAELTGYSHEELLDLSLSDLILPEDPPRDPVRLDEIRSGAMVTDERRIRRKDGGLIPVEVITRMLPAGYLLRTVRDISKRMQAEEVLRESEARLSQTTENAPGLIYQFLRRPDGSSCFPYASAWCREMFGIPPETLRLNAAPLIDRILPEDRSGFEASMARSAQTLELWRWEGRLRSATGTVVWHQGISKPERQPDGSILWSGIFFDVTERVRVLKELADMKTLLESAFEQTPIPMILVSAPDHIIRIANPAAYEFFGLEGDSSPTGHSLFDLERTWQTFDSEGRPMTLNELPLALALQGTTTKGKEYSVLRKDGTRRWELITSAPIYNQSGDLIAAYLAFPDITERKRAEAALRETTEALRALIDSSPISIIALDPEGNVKQWNPASERMFGWQAAEVLGRFLPIVPEDKREEHRSLRQRVLRGEAFTAVEVSRLKKDGSPIDLSISTVPLRNAAGKITGIMAVSIDLAERKRLEETLRENEERLRLALLAANQGLFDLNVQTGEAVVNPEYARLLGFDSDSFRETNAAWRDRLHPDDREQVYRFYQEYIEGRRDDYRVEFRQRTKSGDWKWILSLGKIVEWDQDGNPLRMLGTHTDITERKQIEADRLEVERRLLQAQKLESLGVLAGGIAHDFNNMLTAILGYADLALLEVSPVSPVRPRLQEIINASHRAADLCRQMLAYSGKGKFVIERLELGELVREMIHLFKACISKKVLLNLNLADGVPPIEADPAQIRQVLMNLVVNASEAIGEKSGVVTISTAARVCDRATLRDAFLDDSLPEGLYMSLEVSDTGCGMDRETQARIFEPFFTTKFTGRGLGMSAVLGIVRGHHGAIQVYSEPGRGTTFRLLFPASVQVGQAPTRKKVGPGGEWHGTGTVLLVDDEETILEVGRLMLEKLGFSVITAEDGREAVEIYRRRGDEIAFLLLDLTMPRMNGEEAFRELRRLDPGVRVIIASGYSEQEISTRFAGKGLAGFIQKPYQMTTLREALKKIAPRG